MSIQKGHKPNSHCVHYTNQTCPAKLDYNVEGKFTEKNQTPEPCFVQSSARLSGYRGLDLGTKSWCTNSM
ncbi:hypothetical protein JTE90_008053 [Oedothorax gibbosus]|uniref:Uncharacterized protein n=1 Tax=Oedothorax gibbosus TaxID=931172 RepID=A0AAV6UXH1_9ARAC|nr:hypothetical protein JTE90_008053 [Oedothorax gibbosus]